MLKSELLKFKNSTSLYLILSFTLLEIVTIPLYITIVPQGISLTNLAMLSFLGYPLLTALISILGIDQEKEANHFQEISTYPKKKRLWLAKLFLTDLLLALPSLLAWTIISLFQTHTNYNLSLMLSSWFLILLLNHWHYIIQVWFNKGSNLIIAIVDIIFILFASNKVFLNTWWLPIALPINGILTNDLNQLSPLLFWVVASTLLFILFPPSHH